MSRTQMKWVEISATSALLLALGLGANVVVAGTTTERPIGDFVERQGAFCIRFDFREMNYVDTREDSCPFEEFLFVPPVDNFIGWTDPVAELFASVDYAGLADDVVGSLGTAFTGEVTERLLPDGRAEVTVELETQNALVFIVDGFDVAVGPLLLGERVAANGTIENPLLGKSTLLIVFTNSAPGAPLPDLIQLFFFPEPGQEVIFIDFKAEAESVEGEVKVEQVCPAPCEQNGFVFSVETIELVLSCPWDCEPTPDGNVSTIDLLTLLGQWGGPGSCDFDGGSVATGDLLKLLGNWGPCPK